ncbi:MAG TPA: potassium-transporting ATPase subunit KdpC [Thermomicrobiales bacterium]|nr:potassium-transporting ATPase subunit KdpC [Thermomicrobiales bacterium]
MMRQLRIALLMLIVLTVLTGLAYPLAMTALAQALFPWQANGSLVERDGSTVGSALLGQSFLDPAKIDPQTGDGPTLPGYFRGRPSAAFQPGNGDETLVSSGSNLGPTNKALIDRVAADAAIVRRENGLPANATIPVDLVTASASGVDPDISPAAAEVQIARVARQRGVSEAEVRQLVAQATSGRTLGLFGEPRVNVLALNLALDAAAPMPATVAP